MDTFNTQSSNETKQLASNLAKKLLKTSTVVALYGDLGAGKTTFSQGFAQGLGIKDRVISPTFILLRQYYLGDFHKTLYHFDLYRLENEEGLKTIGFQEIISNPENLVLIEWAEKAEKLLPKRTLRVRIEKGTGNNRTVTFDPKFP